MTQDYRGAADVRANDAWKIRQAFVGRSPMVSDRPYYRDDRGSMGSPLMWLWNGSVPLFTLFGIRVRAHASLCF